MFWYSNIKIFQRSYKLWAQSLKYLRLWVIYLSTHRNFCLTGGKVASVHTGEFKWKFSFFYLFEVLLSSGLQGLNPAEPGWIQRPYSAEAIVSARITAKKIKYSNVKLSFLGQGWCKIFLLCNLHRSLEAGAQCLEYSCCWFFLLILIRNNATFRKLGISWNRNWFIVKDFLNTNNIASSYLSRYIP